MFEVSELFTLQRGVSSGALTISDTRNQFYDIPYLRPSKSYSIQNGYLSTDDDIVKDNICSSMTLVMGNTGQGSHTYTYLITEEFVPNNNLTVLIPLLNLNIYHKLFLINIIEHNRYRYAYGRIPSNNRFLCSRLKLPIDSKGNPDWQFMENYIKSLPYSASLQN